SARGAGRRTVTGSRASFGGWAWVTRDVSGTRASVTGRGARDAAMLAGMVAAVVVLALLSAVLHVVIFVLEAVLFRRPDVHGRFATRPGDVDAVAPWAFNQGFYNLFLAIGAAVGAVLA